jgi:UDP-N-acetylmuramoylalanine--D-glutamate ligase
VPQRKIWVQDYSGQKVVIIGAARQGIALARYLARKGAAVVLNDSRPAEALAEARAALIGLKLEWVTGEHPLGLLDGATLVCPSGGVPLTLPLIAAARERGIQLSNDSQIFLEAAPCPVIGITGSAGKTTVTTLVGRMAAWMTNDERRMTDEMASFRPSSFVIRRVWVGGNIGTPLISLVEEMTPDDLAVMELSSFQLELMTRSPQVAVILNITPNHLDRHGTMAAYAGAKARILAFQGQADAAVLGRDDPGAWGLAGSVRGRLLSFGLNEPAEGRNGTFLRGEDLYLRTLPEETGSELGSTSGEPVEMWLMSRTDIPLRGEHNVLNVLAACAVAAASRLPAEAMRAGVDGFPGVPHRLEFVRSWGGAEWYNDSIATAPERAMAAIRSFEEPLVLLAGGRDKDLPWEDFGSLVRERVDHLILFGECADKVLAAVQERQGKQDNRQPYTIVKCGGLHDAVVEAAQIVQSGDVVLLSPGGTSFDEFRDFEERGAWFKKWVMDL